MRCPEVRDLLTAASNDAVARLASGPHPTSRAIAPALAELAGHLGSCHDCATFANRLAAFRAALPAHRGDHAPGPDFAARVVGQLPGTAEALGWASLRLLPAAVALAFACSWVGFTRGPGLTDLLLHPDDPLLLTYVALGPEPEE
jgi:hypothetical protein